MSSNNTFDSATVQCPFCFESFAIPVDLGNGTEQHFVYDCEICCRPIEVFLSLNELGAQVKVERAYD